MIVGLGIHHLALRTQSLEEVASFYGEVMGLSRVRTQPGYSVWFKLGESAVLMVEKAAPDEPAIPTGDLHLLALHTNDLEAARAHLGVRRVPIESETAHTLYFRDPDGRRVAVSDYPLSAHLATS